MTAVQHAIELLKAKGPADWREKLVSNGPLTSIKSSEDCPLKRIFGSYTKGLDALGYKVWESFPALSAFVNNEHLAEWNEFIALVKHAHDTIDGAFPAIQTEGIIEITVVADPVFTVRVNVVKSRHVGPGLYGFTTMDSALRFMKQCAGEAR